MYRLCRENRILLPRNKKKIRHHSRISINRILTKPNQLWQFDIKYGYIHGENRFFYLLAFEDVFSKEIVSYHIGKSCTAKDLKITFEHAISRRGCDLNQLVIRSDNGPQMTSNQFRDYTNGLVLHEFIPPRCPDKNAFIESFFSIYEIQFLQVHYFKSFFEAYYKTVDYIEFYNNERLHGSIKKLPPVEFKMRYEAGEFGIMECRA